MNLIEFCHFYLGAMKSIANLIMDLFETVIDIGISIFWSSLFAGLLTLKEFHIPVSQLILFFRDENISLRQFYYFCKVGLQGEQIEAFFYSTLKVTTTATFVILLLFQWNAKINSFLITLLYLSFAVNVALMTEK